MEFLWNNFLINTVHEVSLVMLSFLERSLTGNDQDVMSIDLKLKKIIYEVCRRKKWKLSFRLWQILFSLSIIINLNLWKQVIYECSGGRLMITLSDDHGV